MENYGKMPKIVQTWLRQKMPTLSLWQLSHKKKKQPIKTIKILGHV
jgi:hypothetical protein